MLSWLLGNWGTLLVFLVVALIVGLAARSLIRQKKAAKASGGCGCGCSGCSMCSSCHPVVKSK